MGGWGSTRWAGYRRRTTNDAYRLSAADLRRMLEKAEREKPAVVLEVAAPGFAGRQRVQLVAVPAPLGGRRWYLRCSQCGHRRTHLYALAHASLWRCRLCCGLAYVSQRLDEKNRLALRMHALIKRAGGECSPNLLDPGDEFPTEKPKYMHWATFSRFHLMWEAANERWEAVVYGHLARALSRFEAKGWR